MIDAHARLAPSSAPRWVPCPGSVVMQEKLPESDEWSQPREDGNAAHWVGDNVLKADTSFITPACYLGQTAPNGVIITEEMVEAVQVYIDDIHAISDPLAYVNPHSEVRVKMLNDGILTGLNWGTLDCSLVDGLNRIAYVWDFKYGWGIVEAEMNWQTLDYLLGIVDKVGAEHGVNSIPDVFEIRIVQPRPHHPKGQVRVWRITYAELMEYTLRLWASAKEAAGDNPQCVAGPWCKNCSGRHGCSALNGVALECMALSEAAIPDVLSPEQLGKQLTEMKYAADMLEARISGLEAQALAEVRAGKYVPGWEGAVSKGSLKWTKPIPEVISLGTMMGVDVGKEAAMTPLQAIKAGVPETLVKMYSGRSSGGLQLVKADPSRIKNIMEKGE